MITHLQFPPHELCSFFFQTMVTRQAVQVAIDIQPPSSPTDTASASSAASAVMAVSTVTINGQAVTASAQRVCADGTVKSSCDTSDSGSPLWVGIVIGVAVVIVVFFLIYLIYYIYTNRANLCRGSPTKGQGAEDIPVVPSHDPIAVQVDNKKQSAVQLPPLPPAATQYLDEEARNTILEESSATLGVMKQQMQEEAERQANERPSDEVFEKVTFFAFFIYLFLYGFICCIVY